MALPYDWDIATVEEVMEYYADVDGVDLPNLTDRLGDENAPVPVRVDKFLDYNGTWVEKKYYPVEALKVLLWKEPLVAASDLENWLDMPRKKSRNSISTNSAARSASIRRANGFSTRTTC